MVRSPGASEPTSSRSGLRPLAAAAAIVFIGLVWLASPRITAVAYSLVVIGAIVVLASAAVVFLTASDRFVDIAVETSANPKTTAAEIRDFFARFLEANGVPIEAGIGLYLALGGGLLALLGGIIGIVRSYAGHVESRLRSEFVRRRRSSVSPCSCGPLRRSFVMRSSLRTPRTRR